MHGEGDVALPTQTERTVGIEVHKFDFKMSDRKGTSVTFTALDFAGQEERFATVPTNFHIIIPLDHNPSMKL